MASPPISHPELWWVPALGAVGFVAGAEVLPGVCSRWAIRMVRREQPQKKDAR